MLQPALHQYEHKTNIKKPFPGLMKVRCEVCAQGHGKARDSEQFCVEANGKDLWHVNLLYIHVDAQNVYHRGHHAFEDSTCSDSSS